MRAAIFAAPRLAAALALAACAEPPEVQVAETRPVDARFATDGARSFQGAELRFAGLLEERDGATFGCVAIGHNEHPAARLAAAEMKVALRFHVDGEKIDAPLRFAAVHPATLDLDGLDANCASLGVPWEPRFGAGETTLEFRTLRV
ncbi:MAG: hypothetical protein AAF322_05195 [Pseudomonadota bacterium]